MARKNLSTKIENDLQKEVKKLAIDLERPFNDLLEEAIRDILEKYGVEGLQERMQNASVGEKIDLQNFSADGSPKRKIKFKKAKETAKQKVDE